MIDLFFLRLAFAGIATIFVLCADVTAQERPATKSEIWKKIAPFFAPPDSLRDVMGTYRSPLTFYSGERVKTKRDWKRRRDEIRSKWHDMMGEWPALMKDQKLEFLDSVRKEGFTQYSVRFAWIPGELTRGYLLVPHHAPEKRKPAVITV